MLQKKTFLFTPFLWCYIHNSEVLLGPQNSGFGLPQKEEEVHKDVSA